MKLASRILYTDNRFLDTIWHVLCPLPTTEFKRARGDPTMSTAPGKRRGRAATRTEALREAIEDKIATGAFPPGMRLDETELTQKFGVSRTPLREALIQL